MKTMQPNEIKIVNQGKPKFKELVEELKVKKAQLEEHEARLMGGYSPMMNRDMHPIGKEIEQFRDFIQVKNIELAQFKPCNPYWEYEKDETWLELNKKAIREIISQRSEVLAKVEEQCGRITKEIPELKARIAELEGLTSQ